MVSFDCLVQPPYIFVITLNTKKFENHCNQGRQKYNTDMGTHNNQWPAPNATYILEWVLSSQSTPRQSHYY